MTFTLRKMVPVQDYARIASIMTHYSDTPVDADHVAHMYRLHEAGDIRVVLCAVDEAGVVRGFGSIAHLTVFGEGVFYGGISVEPTHTRQGIGAALYEAVYAEFLALGGTCLRGRVGEGSTAGLAFAERRGYRPTHRIFQSYLEVATFDETPFVEVLARVTAQGFRLSTLADEGSTRENLYKLYELDRSASLSLPDWEGAFLPFDQYADNIQDDPDFDPAAKYLAIDSATGAYVGMAGLFYDAATRIMTHEFTAVEPAYQGRGIALALKLTTIRHAKAQGAQRLYAHNHSQNAPILAMNRKLGYQAMPGFWFYERREGAV